MQEIRSKVAGVTAWNKTVSRQSIIREQVDEGDSLMLEREPDNKFDKNAIAVYSQPYGAEPAQIGYIKAELAKRLAPVMDAGGMILCSVLQVTGKDAKYYDDPDDDEERNFGVNICLEIFTADEWIIEQEKRVERRRQYEERKRAEAAAPPAPKPPAPLEIEKSFLDKLAGWVWDLIKIFFKKKPVLKALLLIFFIIPMCFGIVAAIFSPSP